MPHEQDLRLDHDPLGWQQAAPAWKHEVPTLRLSPLTQVIDQ